MRASQNDSTTPLIPASSGTNCALIERWIVISNRNVSYITEDQSLSPREGVNRWLFAWLHGGAQDLVLTLVGRQSPDTTRFPPKKKRRGLPRRPDASGQRPYAHF